MVGALLRLCPAFLQCYGEEPGKAATGDGLLIRDRILQDPTERPERPMVGVTQSGRDANAIDESDLTHEGAQRPGKAEAFQSRVFVPTFEKPFAAVLVPCFAGVEDEPAAIASGP